jgi:protein CpxP
MKQPNDASKGKAPVAALHKRWLAGIAAAGALSAMFALAPPASAQADGDRATAACAGRRPAAPQRDGLGERRMEQRVERMFTEVGASDEQKARAREIVQASMAEMQAMRPVNREGMTEMRALLSAETIDRDRIEQHRAARHAQANRGRN